MSWQEYVDTNLLGSKVISAAGIYDLTGNPWAYSAGFAAQVAEVGLVAKEMIADTTTNLAGTGVVIAGIKYMFVSGSHDEVYAKKGNTGVVIQKCNTCVIVCTHGEHPPFSNSCGTARTSATRRKIRKHPPYNSSLRNTLNTCVCEFTLAL